MSIDVSRFTDEQIAAVKAELLRRMGRLKSYIEEQLRKAPRDAQGRILPRDPRTLAIVRETLANAIPDFEAILGEAAPDAFKAVAADVLTTVTDDLVQQGVGEAFTTASAEVLTATVDGTLTEIAERVGAGSQSLRETIADVLSSPVPVDEAIETIAGELDLTTAQTVTVIDTGTMAVDRTAVVAQADDAGFGYYLFDGPVDDLTRDWCRARVGKLFTLDELNEEPNDTGPQPPSAFAGGYNCRHRWVPISAEEAGQYPRWQGRPLLTSDDRRALAA